MPVNIVFYTVKERRPVHGESVIWLQGVDNFGYSGYDPREVTAEYQWTELDPEDGRETGNSVCYHEGDAPMDNYRLDILFDDWIACDNCLWCPVEEYWKYFDTEEDNVENNRVQM